MAELSVPEFVSREHDEVRVRGFLEPQLIPIRVGIGVYVCWCRRHTANANTGHGQKSCPTLNQHSHRCNTNHHNTTHPTRSDSTNTIGFVRSDPLTHQLILTRNQIAQNHDL